MDAMVAADSCALVCLTQVELGTSIYLAGLFVLLKALEELGVVQFIADHTASLIGQFPEGAHATSPLAAPASRTPATISAWIT